MRSLMKFLRSTKVYTLLKKPVKEILFRIRGFLRIHGIFRTDNDQKLASYKDKHLGDSCFLIGNGPSLSAADLDLLAGRKSIACNMVYRVFGKTTWRPDYHCVTESAYAKKYAQEFAENIQTPFFTTRSCKRTMPVVPKETVFVDNLTTDEYYVRGNLLDYYVTPFASVMVFMLELAIYMGFKRIYLLGVDNTNSLKAGGHFTKGYESNEIIDINIKRVEAQLKTAGLNAEQAGDYQVLRAQRAYLLLKQYADAHGIQIYNATRGGMLEIFPRVTLEDALAEHEEEGI